MKLWIARQRFSNLCILYETKPYKVYDKSLKEEIWTNDYSCSRMSLPIESFPEVTFENSPQRVELRLVEE